MGREGRKDGWGRGKVHVDVFVSEIDGDDEGVRGEVQGACGFEPVVGVEWVGARWGCVARQSLVWVLGNGGVRGREGLVGRVRGGWWLGLGVGVWSRGWER